MKVRVERQIGASILSLGDRRIGQAGRRQLSGAVRRNGRAGGGGLGGPRPGDFFPLTCDYRERVAAAGKFPGGFLKREGRPTIKETLTARLMDRPIRPLFPEWFHDEVQIQAFVMASDRQSDGDVLAMNGASAAWAFRRCRSKGRSARCGWATSTASSCRSPRTTSWRRATWT